MLKKHLTLLLFLCATCALHATNYLTFTAEEDDSKFGIKTSSNWFDPDIEIQYSLDEGKTWSVLPTNTLIPLSRKGDKALLKGKKIQTSTQDKKNYIYFFMTGSIAASGSVMSLIDGNDKNLTITGKNRFYRLFKDCTSLTKAPELPALNLGESCYKEMFSGCTNLKQAPILPATTLAENCYRSMFYKCDSLKQAPELPATTLSVHCYEKMFYGCTSLTTAPTLPAPTLTMSCYEDMFHGCTHLNSVTCFATSEINSSNNSTSNWLYNVASSGTFTKNASTPTGSGTSGQYWPTGDASGIPSGWTVTEQ